ncbi:MAG TPA: molybdopterin-dependent oxidoreductase, partial [Gemmatimonadaceae bacterium]
MSEKRISRRSMIAGSAATAGGILLSGLPASALQQTTTTAPPPLPVAPADPTAAPGTPTTPVGTRSPFVTATRTPTGEITGTALSPIHEFSGTLTPSDLHFTRIHAGIPLIDPTKHRLLVHGLVDRPLEFTVDDLKRFPSTTRIHFIECSGNG